MSVGCEDWEDREERLVALLYEDGDPAMLEETRAHLATCAACREEYGELTSARELLTAWPDVVDAPRVIYVDRPAGAVGRRGIWPGWRSLVPSLAAAATVVLLVGLSLPFVRFQVGPDGRMGFGIGGQPVAGADQSAIVTKADLDDGLAQTAQYLEALVQRGRAQDRQAVLEAVDRALSAQNASTQAQVSTAITSAFDEMDQRRRADANVLLSAMSDLQVMTRGELQQINSVLASLAPATSPDQE